MKIAIVTAGAGGMFCGSCMKDNTLAAELIREGHDTLLIPTYTPITTDEADVSHAPILFGGINVFLQQKLALFRHTPRFVDAMLDKPWLLRAVSRFAVRTQAKDLADLALSMLEGEQGKQHKELDRFLRYLEKEVKPDVVLLSNVLLSGMVPAIRKRLKIPVWAILQGDDIFLEDLPHEWRDKCVAQIRKNCDHLTGIIASSAYYADFMAGYLGLPRERMQVVLPGINLKGHGGERPFRKEPPYTIGYFARICPEKGFHNLVDAFIKLRRKPHAPMCKLKVSGWLGSHRRAFFDEQIGKLEAAGLHHDMEYVESPGHAEKIRFLQSIDVLSVPTVYHESKGLYILEALANQVPVVQPRHGSFPELVQATGGGVLVEPNNAQALADGLIGLLNDVEKRKAMTEGGQMAIYKNFGADRMAKETLAILTGS